jgi:hypothetical protein
MAVMPSTSVRAHERRAAGQHLEHGAAERPDVHAAVEGVSAQLFRRHVLHGAEQGAGARFPARRAVGIAGARHGGLGQTEVEHLHGAIRPDADVGRFEVPVHDAVVVREAQRVGDAARDAQGAGEWNRPAAAAVGEGLALDQFHDHSRAALPGFDAEDRRDARVIERREDERFTLEPAGQVGVARVFDEQHLDGDMALQLRVERAVHLAHAARAEHALHFVGTNERTGRKGHAGRLIIGVAHVRLARSGPPRRELRTAGGS